MLFESLQNGRYQTVRELSQGSMGEVFLVNDTVISRNVAIKVMRADPAAYPNTESIKDAIRLFKREAQAIARLEHARILPLFDFGEEKNEKTVFTYMVMPYCQEGSLADWLKRHRPDRPVPFDEVAYFVEQAAEALQYAHEQGIIHQDVKPSNFLLRLHASGQFLPDLLLADFGIARMSQGSQGSAVSTITSLSAEPRGTPRYMPPEQWQGKPVPASDQYALAVMAYYLLTLKFPFMGEQVMQLMYQHLRGELDPPGKWNPAIPSALDTVILRALSREASGRFASISEFAHAFRQALHLPHQARGPRFAPSTEYETQIAASTAENLAGQTSRPERYSSPGPLILPASSFVTPSLQTQVASPGQASGQPPYVSAQTLPPAQQQRIHPVQMPIPNPSVRPQVPSSTSWGPVEPRSARGEERPGKREGRGKVILIVSMLLLVVLVGSGGGYAFYLSRYQPPVTADPNVNPYASDMQVLRFADPLDKARMWQSLPYDQQTDGFCLFQQGAYHTSSNKPARYTLCPPASQQPLTTEMTFEVQMQILHGDCGGLLFRGDFTLGKFYYFDVCFDGLHYFAIYNGVNSSQNVPLAHHAEALPALKANSQAKVTIGIVTRGSLLTFYLDGQQADQVTETTYSGGQIALFSFAIDHPTEVVFSHARLWTAKN